MSDRSHQQWGSLLLRLIAHPASVVAMITRFTNLVQNELPALTADQHQQALNTMIVRGCAETLHERGSRFGWNYARVEELRVPLTRGMLGIAQASFQVQVGTSMNSQAIIQEAQRALDHAGRHLDAFVDAYMAPMRDRQGPFAGCIYCRARCLYRSDIYMILSEKDRLRVEGVFNKEDSTTGGGDPEEVADTALEMARRWLGADMTQEEDEATLGHIAGVGYCATLHAASLSDLSDYEQEEVGRLLNEQFQGTYY